MVWLVGCSLELPSAADTLTWPGDVSDHPACILTYVRITASLGKHEGAETNGLQRRLTIEMYGEVIGGVSGSVGRVVVNAQLRRASRNIWAYTGLYTNL